MNEEDMRIDDPAMTNESRNTREYSNTSAIAN
jgi:hypothetical protein